MAAGGSYFKSRLGGGSAHSIVGGGGAPPVTTKRGDFKNTDKHYALKLNAYNRALRNAAKKRAAKKQNAPSLSGPGSFTDISFAAPAPPTQPIIDPFPGVLKGVAADTAGARQAVGREYKESKKALKNLGAGSGGVAGANLSDIYMGGLSGIAGASRGIKQGIGAQASQFILQQIQQRQQFQMEQMQRNQITPDTLRQLVASGINPSQVNLNDPYAVAMALGQAQASGGSGGGLSFGQIASLAQAGIDPDLYRDDPYGAAKALGKSKRAQTTPSQADIAALLKAAQ